MDTEKKILQIPIEDIVPNRFQPRLAFDNDSLKELANSINEHGIIQPLVLRRIADKYEIIAGERRYRAAQIAGLDSVPAIISEMSDTQSAEVAIVENVQRKDLSSIEEAKSYKALIEKNGFSQEDLAHKMGLSQSAISNKLRLLSLNEDVQNAILSGKISERHARSLLKLANSEDQTKFLNRIINERLTVKQLEQELKKVIPKVTNIDNNNQNDIATSYKKEEGDNKMNNETPNKVPNKFFNFLEDYSANMNIDSPSEDEQTVDIFSVNPEISSLVEPKEEIKETILSEAPVIPEAEEVEMLDDFFSESTPESIIFEKPQNNRKDNIVNKIKELLKEEKGINITDFEDEKNIEITIKISKEN